MTIKMLLKGFLTMPSDSLNSNSTVSTYQSTQHTPFDTSLWTGRHEPYESQRARYWYQLVSDYTNQPVCLIGFACDQGVRRNLGRVGAKEAPKTIRKAFAKLPCSTALQDRYQSQLQDESNDNALMQLIGDAGDVYCHDGDKLMDEVLELAQSDYTQRVKNIIRQGSLAVGLGGGHAIAYASYLGLWEALNERTEQTKLKAPRIGIINFDAHLDLRQAPTGTSGTPFRQIAEYNLELDQAFNYCAIGISQFSNTAALFDRASELGVTIISDDSCVRLPWVDIKQQLDSFIQSVDVIYLTIDMDGFESSVVPGVSAPAAKGLSLDFVERCIEHIFAQGIVKMADIAETNPTYDIDGRSSKVAARLLALMAELHLTQDK